MPNENNSNGPPQPNPVLTAYEGYVRDTPLLTRYILNSLLLSYLLSFFANPAYALANIPLFTIFKFELYRIFTSPLVCADILSLIFAFMGFMNHGIKLEQSVGSCMFGVLFFTLTVASNVLFLLVSVLLWGLTNSESYLVGASMGIWSVLLAIIAVECSQAPPDTKRKLFFLTVPTLYYPLVLLALFSMFAGVKLAYCLGVAVGYAYGYGKLDRLKVKVERVSLQWSDLQICYCPCLFDSVLIKIICYSSLQSYRQFNLQSTNEQSTHDVQSSSGEEMGGRMPTRLRRKNGLD
eukprot:g8299.t1.1.5e17418a g8299  g8299.t1 contig29:183337-184314(-)